MLRRTAIAVHKLLIVDTGLKLNLALALKQLNHNGMVGRVEHFKSNFGVLAGYADHIIGVDMNISCIDVF